MHGNHQSKNQYKEREDYKQSHTVPLCTLDRWPPNFGQVTILPVLPGHDLGVGARRDLGGDQGEEDAGGVAGVQVEELGVVAGEDVEDAGAGHLATVTPGRWRNCPL